MASIATKDARKAKLPVRRLVLTIKDECRQALAGAGLRTNEQIDAAILRARTKWVSGNGDAIKNAESFFSKTPIGLFLYTAPLMASIREELCRTNAAKPFSNIREVNQAIARARQDHEGRILHIWGEEGKNVLQRLAPEKNARPRAAATSRKTAHLSS